MKKYLALLLVLVMALGLFAACNNEPANNTTAPKTDDPVTTTAPKDTTPAPKDPITLVWHIRGVGTQTDHEKVEAEFNKILQSRPGFEHITVDLRHNVSGEHRATVERAFTAKEQIDIVCTVNLKPVDMAREGYFVGLSEYFEDHQTLWNTYPEWLWETQYVDDDYYVVPNYQRGSNPKYFAISSENAKLVDWAGFEKLVTYKNGYSAGTIDEICAKIEEMYLALKAAGKDIYMDSPVRMIDGYNQLSFWKEFLEGQTPTGGGVYADFNTSKVNSLWLSEEFKTLWKWACKWQDAGYFPKDAATAEAGTYSFANGKYFLEMHQTSDWDLDSMKEVVSTAAGFDCEVIRYTDKIYMENRWAAGGNAVSDTCANPEDAVAFLELLGTDVELYNCLVYGLEGTHWEWVNKDTNQIKTLQYDGSQASGQAPYGMLKWCVGNTFIAYLNQACSLTENESALYINENGESAPWAGLQIDFTDMKTAQDNINAVNSEWKMTRIYWGQDGEAGFEAAYATYVAALKNAGVEDIIESAQEQIDDFIASKK